MFNETTLKRLRYTDKDQWISDPATRGLYLRVSKSDLSGTIEHAAWVVRQKIHGKTRRNVIGHWPSMSLQDARRQRDIVLGVDVKDQTTVGGLLDEYDQAVLSHQKSGNQARVYLRQVRGKFGPRLANTVRRAELTGMLQKYSRERGARSADRLLSFLRGCFGYAVECGYIQASPIEGVTKRVTGYRPRPRERVLTDDELALIWEWEGHQAALLRFLVLTALRIGEAQQGYRDGDRWNVPAEISKNTDAHWVHLTPSAIQQLDQAGGSFDTSPTASQAWLKRKLDNLEYDDAERFTPHDLRRTAATRMGDAGVAPHVIEKVLNHRLRGVAQTYNRAELQPERIEAAKLLEQAIFFCSNKGAFMSSINYIKQREQIVVDAWEAFLQLRKQGDLPGEFQDLFRALKEVAVAGIDCAEALEEVILDRKLSDRRKQPHREAAIYAAMAEILVTKFNVILVDYTAPNLPRGFWDPVLDLLSKRGIMISRQALTKFMENRSDRWHKVNNEMVTKWMPVWLRQPLEDKNRE